MQRRTRKMWRRTRQQRSTSNSNKKQSNSMMKSNAKKGLCKREVTSGQSEGLSILLL
jgi:hypothetical protein